MEYMCVIIIRQAKLSQKKEMLLGFNKSENNHHSKFVDKSDEEVLAHSINNPSAYEEIVNRYQEAFIRKARRIIGNREEVKDIVQETFTKIYLNAGRFKVIEGASFKSWGYKILLNTTFTYYQKLKKKGERTVELDSEILEAFPDLSMSDIEKRELRDYVVSILTRLPRTLCQVLQMQFLQGQSQQEIAEKEGVTIGAIKTRVHRAKKEFRREISSIQI